MTGAERQELDQLLKSAGSPYDSTAVTDLIAGVLAAPGDDGGMGTPDDWHALVAPEIPEALDVQLRKIHQGLADALGPEQIGQRAETANRIAALRDELESRGLDGFVVPLADEHQGEYVPKRAQRLAWLTGFTGSAGIAIVLRDSAAIFVDGRYTLQVKEQTDTTVIQDLHISENPPDEWIAENLSAASKLGYDPWLHTVQGARRLSRACRRANAELVATQPNPIDTVWSDQPAAPLSNVTFQDVAFAGQEVGEKLSHLAGELEREHQDAVVLTAPPSIAWLANLRGGDVPYTPLPLSFAIAHVDGRLELFIDSRKFPAGKPGIPGSDVAIRPPEQLPIALDELGKANKIVRLDYGDAADAIAQRLTSAGAVLADGTDPCVLPRARKNTAELDGTRAAHRRDGAALSQFLCWLETAAAGGELTEMGAADRLEQFRRQNELIRGLSFPTISGAGPNGAIVHYRVTTESDRRIEPGSLYLVDSGAQYLDGTTDVTRTVAIGAPTPEMKDRFTRVLKGHIAIATARFPTGTSGSQLDALARTPLWQAGLDYDHGTGHGVGSFLGVHEGPHRISKIPNRVGLEPGMIVSNEPGYYKTDAYGIRIENLVVVVTCDMPEGGERELFGFETLTLAPIDRNLIDIKLLRPDEIEWLNAYHKRVLEVIGPLVDELTAAWLIPATAPL